jgi:hypothetical protein
MSFTGRDGKRYWEPAENLRSTVTALVSIGFPSIVAGRYFHCSTASSAAFPVQPCVAVWNFHISQSAGNSVIFALL